MELKLRILPLLCLFQQNDLSSTSNFNYDITELPIEVDICEDEDVSISQELNTAIDDIAEYVPNSIEKMEDELDGTWNTCHDLSNLLDDIGERLTTKLSASISTSIISQLSA